MKLSKYMFCDSPETFNGLLFNHGELQEVMGQNNRVEQTIECRDLHQTQAFVSLARRGAVRDKATN